jgi:hypothetical protein
MDRYVRTMTSQAGLVQIVTRRMDGKSEELENAWPGIA